MKDADAAAASRQVRVWDLPTRLFHWSLVLLVAVNITTGNLGGMAAMDWHMRSGYAILALLLFRLAWGLVGSTSARFASFVRGPAAVLAYARGLFKGRHEPAVGHNPMGALSVIALLASLLVQAATGLFADDAILTKGPLADDVSRATSKVLTGIHALNANVLYALIALHLAAVFYYLLVRRENLITAMITGWKRLPAAVAAALPPARFASPLLALVLAAAAAALVWWIVDR